MFAGHRAYGESLCDYERKHNKSTMPDFRTNISSAQFRGLPPEIYQNHATIRGDAEERWRFFLAFERMIPPQSFFNPENMARLVGGAGPPRSESTTTTR